MILILDMVCHIANHRPKQRNGRRIGHGLQEIKHKHQTDIGGRGNKEKRREECCQRETDHEGILLTILIRQETRQAHDTHKLHDGTHHIESRETDGISLFLLNVQSEECQELIERPLVNIILEIEAHGRSPHGQCDKQSKGQQGHRIP